MARTAKAMKTTIRRRKLENDLVEIRVIAPDPRSQRVRREIAEEMAGLDPRVEDDAMRWIEAVSLFDEQFSQDK